MNYRKSLISDLRYELDNESVTSEELFNEAVSLANKYQEPYNCFVTICDKFKMKKRTTPLAGIPYALKDNISDPSDYVKHIKDNILTAPLVVWDEVGVKALSEYEHEHLLNFINARIDMQKANIYTSNMNALQLKEKLGERLFSRFYNLSTIITLHGSDKRGIL